MIHKTLLAFLIIITQLAAGQRISPDTAQGDINRNCFEQLREITYLHLNQNLIVAGERLFFKAYVIDNYDSPAKESKILYVELLDSKNNVKANIRINADNESFKGSMTIPDSLATGIYRITAYTNLMLNFPTATFNQISLVILGLKNNPEIKPLDKANAPLDTLNNGKYPAHSFSQEPEKLKMQHISMYAKMNKQEYGRREKVILNLKMSDYKNTKGNISISVFERNPGFLKINPDISTVINTLNDEGPNSAPSDVNHQNLSRAAREFNKWHESISSKGYLPLLYSQENIGYLLKGTVHDQTGKAASGKKILLSTPDSLLTLKYSITDSAGKFVFALDKRFDNKKLIISVFTNEDQKDYSIALDNKQAFDSLMTRENFITDNRTSDYFLKCKKIAFINKVYAPKDNTVSPNLYKNIYFNALGKPNYTVYMSDYLVEFEDFKDITKNALPGVKLKKKKNKYSVIVTDLDNRITWTENCLVLLNNIPFSNYEYLATLGSKQIDHIDVILRNVALGSINFYGVVSVFTKDKTIIPDRHSIVLDNKVENDNIPYPGIYKDYTRDLSKQPHFVQALYWNPDLTIDNAGTTIEFYTSDLVSDYIVDIEGLTNEGAPLSEKLVFKVQ